MSRRRSDYKNIGCLFHSASPAEGGEKYETGYLELGDGKRIRIVVFKNDKKKESKHPDKIIYYKKEGRSK